MLKPNKYSISFNEYNEYVLSSHSLTYLAGTKRELNNDYKEVRRLAVKAARISESLRCYRIDIDTLDGSTMPG